MRTEKRASKALWILAAMAGGVLLPAISMSGEPGKPVIAIVVPATGPQDSVCYGCHPRKDTKKLVHGPLGSGECAVCHDTQGSAHGAFTESPGRLCVSCHDQNASAGHIAKSRGKTCTACHDPHSSEKKFLIR